MTDELADQVRAHVRERFEVAQVPFFRALVEQPSCSREPQDVEAAARILDAVAARLGLSRTLYPDPDDRFADHRVYTSAAARGQVRALALVGHVDTVFPRALGFFGFHRDGDVVRGPGVLDMKSGLSAIFFALDALKAVAPQRYQRLAVRVVVVSDEEVGSPSSAPLFSRLALTTRAALVFEAGRAEDRVVTRRKGSASWEIEVQGRAAHAGLHHAEGLSAIHGLALLIPRVEALTNYDRGVTVNVGLVEGGTAKNTVPATARAIVDGRYVRPSDGPRLEAAMRELLAAPLPPDAPLKLDELTFHLTGGITRPPLEATRDSESLRLRYERHAAFAGLRTGEAPLQGGGSDANLLAAAGVPTIDGLGPYGRHFHRPDEWSSLSSLRRRTEALATFLLEEAE
jgi:glutamate carboxypeptidase